jgi:maltooligosyltrehalose trehalohydrolase
MHCAHEKPPWLARDGLTLGAHLGGGANCSFCVWAPNAEAVEVHILAPRDRVAPLERQDRGYYTAVLEDVEAGTDYRFRLRTLASPQGEEHPDPASRHQPQVHGPSRVVDCADLSHSDAGWSGIPLEDYIIYELHVGTYTPEGTFAAIIPHLDELQELGITAIELMPVAQFPGSRNWGYDGVYPYAVQESYGGPAGLRLLVEACHQRGIAVVLDVVYNHLGPEGNYLSAYGPYFTDRYKTPWGAAINFDGPYSDDVVRFFVENALYWVRDFHIDALRLDAIHGIVDVNATPFLALLTAAVERIAVELGRSIYVIAESDLNDVRVVRPRESGGLGVHGTWSDDFHHSLHTLLTRETNGYYADFGKLEHLAKAFREGFVYSGQYSRRRQRRHGNSSDQVPARQFVVCAQNHDQVGNRMLGERLTQLVDFSRLKLAAATVLLAPFIPLLFMGEEYGEDHPFLYFTSHSDPQLIAAVREGRQREFASFNWQGEVPDPQQEETFRRSKLDHDSKHYGLHQTLRDFYKELLRLRKQESPLACLSKDAMEVTECEDHATLLIRRWSGGPGEAQREVAVILQFGGAAAGLELPLPAGKWRKILDSSHPRWMGRGTSIPDQIYSEGAVSLEVEPGTVVLLKRM